MPKFDGLKRFGINAGSPYGITWVTEALKPGLVWPYCVHEWEKRSTKSKETHGCAPIM